MDKRSSGRERRDSIFAAIERFHLEHDTWPTRAIVAHTLGLSKDNLRHHITRLIEAGLLEKAPGETIKIVRHGGEPQSIPGAVVALDDLILEAVREASNGTDEAVRLAEISQRIARQRALLSRRCTYLVAAGKLRRVGAGYCLVPTDEQK